MQLSKVPEEMTNIDNYPSRRPQIANLIVEEAITNVFAKYGNFADIFSLTLKSTTMLSNWSMPTNLSNHLSHLQILLSFSSRSRMNFFGCMSIIETLIMFLAISILIVRVVTIVMTVSMAMIGLILQDKLGKVWFFQENFLLADICLVLEMLFFNLSNALAKAKLIWRTYIAANTLLVEGFIRKRFAS